MINRIHYNTILRSSILLDILENNKNQANINMLLESKLIDSKSVSLHDILIPKSICERFSLKSNMFSKLSDELKYHVKNHILAEAKKYEVKLHHISSSKDIISMTDTNKLKEIEKISKDLLSSYNIHLLDASIDVGNSDNKSVKFDFIVFGEVEDIEDMLDDQKNNFFSANNSFMEAAQKLVDAILVPSTKRIKAIKLLNSLDIEFEVVVGTYITVHPKDLNEIIGILKKNSIPCTTGPIDVSNLSARVQQSYTEESDMINYMDGFEVDYEIKSDGTIDVHGDIDMHGFQLTEFPVKFGKIYGNFICSENKLTSLLGAPKEVTKKFDCNHNQIASLIGGPTIVGGDYYCAHNKLTSLAGAPKEVDGFYCSNNKLKSLDGAPHVVNDNFDCAFNDLTSLVGAPKEVATSFVCSGNKLTSLEGCPPKVGKSVMCSNNKLTSLEGCPSKTEGLDCSYNQLASLEHCPKLSEYLTCSNNHLTSLDDAPDSTIRHVDCSNNDIKFTREMVKDKFNASIILA